MPFNNSLGSRYLSKLKSELVRNHLVTRTDLMKMYQPPTKKGDDPKKNPFTTNTFFPDRNSQMAETMAESKQSHSKQFFETNKP